MIYSIRFAGTAGFPRDRIIDSGTVKWLSVGGSGTDHMAGWDQARLMVTNAAGVAADMIAEYVLGAMLSFSLGFRRFAQAQANRKWVAGRVAPVQGSTVLIIGLRKTGEASARRSKAMGLKVLGIRARPAPTAHVDEVHGVAALHDLLPCADFIVLCVPLLDSTQGMVTSEAFDRMKPGAVLIDVSRGGIVDQDALIQALVSGRIQGAALDVFSTEPLPADSPLWAMDNVIITPHCSSVYDGWGLKSAAMFAENLTRYRRGEQLHNIADPDRGY